MAVNPEEYTYLWKDRIVSHPEILGGKPIVKGTRLSVEFVTNRLYGGNFTAEEFVEEYHHVTLEDVYTALEYAATGARLSNSSWTEYEHCLDMEEEYKKEKWLADWKAKQTCAYSWEGRIVSTPGFVGGKPRIKDTRLSVEFVTDIMRVVDFNEESFLAEHPYITREDLLACLEYAATGAKLSNATWAELNRQMNEEEELRKRQWLSEWKKKDAPDG